MFRGPIVILPEATRQSSYCSHSSLLFNSFTFCAAATNLRDVWVAALFGKMTVKLLFQFICFIPFTCCATAMNLRGLWVPALLAQQSHLSLVRTLITCHLLFKLSSTLTILLSLPHLHFHLPPLHLNNNTNTNHQCRGTPLCQLYHYPPSHLYITI